MRFPSSAVTAFIAVVAIPALATAQNPADVKAAIEKHYAAIHADNLDEVMAHHRPEMTWFPNDGRLLLDAESRAAAEGMGAVLNYGSLNVYMSDFNVQMYGNVAVATFYLTGNRVGMSQSEYSTSRVTAVWILENGVWTEAHHHESPLKGAVEL